MIPNELHSFLGLQTTNQGSLLVVSQLLALRTWLQKRMSKIKVPDTMHLNNHHLQLICIIEHGDFPILGGYFRNRPPGG